MKNKYILTLFSLILIKTPPLLANECSYLFRFSGVFKEGRNPELILRMQRLQVSMNEVESFISNIYYPQNRSLKSFQEAYVHAKELVDLSQELVNKAGSELAPARVMQKPIDEREKYLQVYEGMYRAQLKMFQIVLESFNENSAIPMSQWNFSNAKQALLDMQTIMTRAHLKY